MSPMAIRNVNTGAHKETAATISVLPVAAIKYVSAMLYTSMSTLLSMTGRASLIYALGTGIVSKISLFMETTSRGIFYDFHL